MSDTITKPLPYRVDLAEPIKKTYLETLFATQDSDAHRFDISLYQNKAALQMPSVAAVSAYFIRYGDKVTIPLIGSASGNVISVKMSKACYNKPGQFALVIKAVIGDAISTVFYGEGSIFVSSTEKFLDPEDVIPSLEDLLAQIAAMEAAVNSTNAATNRANTAAARAEALAIDASGYAGDSNKLGGQLPGYYAKQEDVNQLSQQMAALQSGVEIVPTVSGSVVAVSDASNLPLRGLILHGKTTQDGTPSPDNPVELVTAGSDGDIVVTACGKNIFDSSLDGAQCLGLGYVNTNEYNFSISEYDGAYVYRVSVKGGETYVFSTNAPNMMANIRFEDELHNLVEGMNWTNVKNRPFWIPEKAVCIAFSIVKEDLNQYVYQLELGDTATAYEPYKDGGSVIVSTPNGLPGIPVTSGGNYTDASGQQWVCDEIDLERGLKIQRVKEYLYNGSENWHVMTVSTGVSMFALNIDGNPVYKQGLSSYGYEHFNVLDNGGYGSTIVFEARARGQEWNPDNHTVDEFKTYLSSNNLRFLVPLSEPIVTNLTDTELAAYRALVTNKPNTTIYNDAGCDQTVRYVADTQTYIDNRLAAIAAVSLEG